jgi:predicted metal-binding protein
MREEYILSTCRWTRGIGLEKYFEFLKLKGAEAAVEIDPCVIVTAPWVIHKCRFGCRMYGHSHCCPPKTPNYKQTQEIINCYKKAILFHCHYITSVTPMAVEAERELFLDGYYKAIGFGSGPCRVCKQCGADSCSFPQKTVPSMEACGIDVFATVRANGFEIRTLRHGDEIQNHFGLLLIE